MTLHLDLGGYVPGEYAETSAEALVTIHEYATQRILDGEGQVVALDDAGVRDRTIHEESEGVSEAKWAKARVYRLQMGSIVS